MKDRYIKGYKTYIDMEVNPFDKLVCIGTRHKQVKNGKSIILYNDFYWLASTDKIINIGKKCYIDKDDIIKKLGKYKKKTV